MDPGTRVTVRSRWPGAVVGDGGDGRLYVQLDSGSSAAYPVGEITAEDGRQWPPPTETKAGP